MKPVKNNNVVKIDRARLREVNDEIRSARTDSQAAHTRAAWWRGQSELAEKRASAAEKRARVAIASAVIGLVVAVAVVAMVLP